jgi:transposase
LEAERCRRQLSPKEGIRMVLHGIAALSWNGRRRLVVRVVVEGWTLAAAAAASGVSVRCAREWVSRYRLDGEQGLRDRSSAPGRVANRTPQERVAVIVKLRRLRFTAAEIAELLGMAVSTVSGILTRLGLGRLGRLGLEQPVRYEHARPGELVHIDVKRLGRIEGGAGKRVTGGIKRNPDLRRLDAAGIERKRIGWEYVHVCVDVECPRFRGQLSAGLSGPAERLSGHAKEAEVSKAVSAGVSAGGGGALRTDRSHARGDRGGSWGVAGVVAAVGAAGADRAR